jgi:hypothetical protein
LDKDVEHEAIRVDGAPKPVFLASDRYDNFIEMPFVGSMKRALVNDGVAGEAGCGGRPRIRPASRLRR